MTTLRRRALLTAAVAGLAASAGAAESRAVAAPAEESTAPEALAPPAPAPTPAKALRRLLAGNRRFTRGGARHPRQGPADLRRLASGQHPFAVVLGCADSRVPPELLFDQGLGDVFDNRVAGNVVDDLVLGSIEFAVTEFAPPLIVVLGHERCGAITATIEAIETGRPAPGHIGGIVAALRPVVERALRRPGDRVDNAVRANVRAVTRQIPVRSAIVRERVATGVLDVVGARYDLDTGRVTLIR